jgi:nucleoside-diphosphate-sugar epimerase
VRILLTGPTGLVGSAILRRLLARGHRVLAVSRGRAGRSAAARIDGLLRVLGLASFESSLEVHDADDGRELAGWLRAHDPADAVVHAAGSVKFTQDVAALRRENPGATARLLDAVDAAAPGAAFHFIGTAYACGRRRGTVLESDRGASAGLSPYEASKLEAEDIVRERCSRRARPWTVLRPSIVGGDWIDGSAASFNGIGQFLRAIDAAGAGRRHREPLLVRCDPASTKNIVPSDWVAAVVVAAVERGVRDETLHLTHPSPPTASEILPMLRQASGIDEIEIARGPAAVSSHPLQGLLDRMLSSFAPYFAGECAFDRRALEHALPNLPAPPPIEAWYLGRLVRFGRSVGWLSRPLEDGVWRSGALRSPSVVHPGKELPCATS